MLRVSMNSYCYYTSCKLELPMNNVLRKEMFNELVKIDLPNMVEYTITNIKESCDRFTNNQIIDS